MSALSYLEQELAALRNTGLLRTPELSPFADGSEHLDVSSNDYLGLARLHVSRETQPRDRTGAGASPLIYGRHPAHETLERELADWVNCDKTLVFSSGYCANIGALTALLGSGDVVISDELNHASVIDGCRLSRANVRVVRHCNLEEVESVLRSSAAARRRWVVTESYFSMEGDSPDLAGLRAVCDRYRAALYVDEAHALGVLGPAGAGLCRQADVAPDVLVGTLGKAVGVQGAFVAGSEELTLWLWNRARSFVFSTGMSPLLARLILSNVRRTKAADAERARIARLSAELGTKLKAAGMPVLPSAYGHIIPIVIGETRATLAIAARLREAGILAQPIRPPTVPNGTSRLRITVSALLSETAVRHVSTELIAAWRAESRAMPDGAGLI